MEGLSRSEVWEAESFAAYVAGRDVACPGCEYNLRGSRGGVCPECGTAVGWWVVKMRSPSEAMFRSAQSGFVVAAVMGLGSAVLGVRRHMFTHHDLRVAEGGVVSMAAALAGAALWMKVRKRAMWWPRHVQGRWATAAWILAAGVVAAAVMVEGL